MGCEISEKDNSLLEMKVQCVQSNLRYPRPLQPGQADEVTLGIIHIPFYVLPALVGWTSGPGRAPCLFWEHQGYFLGSYEQSWSRRVSAGL